MIDLYGVLQEQEIIKGDIGLGVEYYKGETGAQGIPGKDGKDGKTPIKGVDYYTDEEIASIKEEIAKEVTVGAKGEDGKSAYQIALDEGFEGSETDWLASLKGKDGKDGINGTDGKPGKDGTNGVDGKTPVKGVDYFTQAEIQQVENNAAAKVDLSDYAKSADLSTVATSGSYEDLTNKPTIPAAYELPVASTTILGGVKVGSGLEITNGVLSANGGGVADSVDWSKVQNKPNFADVATSGNYNDLSNKPTIPSVKGLASEAYVNEKVAAIVIPEVPTKVSKLENDKGYLTEHQSLAEYAKTADLAQVAKTGSYNDLADKPTIPSTTGLASTKYVDDKVGGIVIPEVPTKISAFENDSKYVTERYLITNYLDVNQVEVNEEGNVYLIIGKDIAATYDTENNEITTTYAKKTEIPEPYTLPIASTSTLGGVKVDGSTITIADGVISAKGGSGGSEPDAYIKDASVSGNTLTLTKKDDTEVVFTPSGGSSGDGSSYTLPAATNTTLGGVKLGNQNPLSITDNMGNYGASLHAGIEEADVPIIPYAQNGDSPGVVKVVKGDGLNYENGVISMSTATTTNYGTVAYDGKTIQAKLNSGDQPTLYAATATASSLGVVKPDGTTTTVDSQGNLSMIGKPAVIKTLITGQAPNWVVDWVANPDKYIVMVNDCVVFRTMKSGTNFYYYWIDNDRIEYYYITFTDTAFTTPNSSQPSYSMAATQLITTDNWQNYITAGGGSDWQYTQDQYDSNLYNAKELVVCVENTQGNKQMGYFYFGYTEGGSSTTLGQNWQNTNFYFDYDISSPYISYNGTMLDCQNKNNLYFILYKT